MYSGTLRSTLRTCVPCSRSSGSTTRHFLQKNSLQCSRTLQDTFNRLNVLRLPHHKSSLPALHPLRTTNIAGDFEIIALGKKEAQLDPEYFSVTTAAEEGQLPDFTEKDGLVWYTVCTARLTQKLSHAFTYLNARPASNQPKRLMIHPPWCSQDAQKPAPPTLLV